AGRGAGRVGAPARPRGGCAGAVTWAYGRGRRAGGRTGM
ncbi:MAG: hypothetical protein AVDCRST_MAG16-2617, partial [uncultured Frankineae bacterium]